MEENNNSDPQLMLLPESTTYVFKEKQEQQELHQAGLYTPLASNKM